MNFRLVDSGWSELVDRALIADRSRVCIISPFIKTTAAKRFLRYGFPGKLEVITRYDLDCFRDRVSDVSALKLLFEAGAKIRGVKNLHSKVYLIGKSHAIVTSANLTEQALTRNHEFGFYTDEQAVAEQCQGYFDKLWKAAGPDVTLEKLEEWNRRIVAAWISGSGTKITPNLGDEGAHVGFASEGPTPTTPFVSEDQGFVKFFGTANDRFDHTHDILDEVDRSGCYFACNYPASKTPRSVRDEAVMFMARLARNPTDIVIFGRGIGMKYVEGRDDATASDLQKRPWKKLWPRYIRVHDVEFVRGTLQNGVSLYGMMEELGANSFASTKRHSLAGQGNTRPRAAFNRQASVELTPEAIAWLSRHLERSFDINGRITKAELDKLDWPEVKL